MSRPVWLPPPFFVQPLFGRLWSELQASACLGRGERCENYWWGDGRQGLNLAHLPPAWGQGWQLAVFNNHWPVLVVRDGPEWQVEQSHYGHLAPWPWPQQAWPSLATALCDYARASQAGEVRSWAQACPTLPAADFTAAAAAVTTAAGVIDWGAARANRVRPTSVASLSR